ncbi:MAG: hypothetical protein QNK11_08615 [Legionella sp.]|nr:hypothetical protein [Legionella sp.]
MDQDRKKRNHEEALEKDPARDRVSGELGMAPLPKGLTAGIHDDEKATVIDAELEGNLLSKLTFLNLNLNSNPKYTDRKRNFQKTQEEKAAAAVAPTPSF